MKNIIRFACLVFIAALTACSPQEFNDYELGPLATATDDQFTFTVTPTDNEYIYNFAVTIDIDPLKVPYSFTVDYGDGEVSKDLTSTHEFKVPAGVYKAVCFLYTTDGTIMEKSKDITIETDHPSLTDTTFEDFLAGGKGSGKTWRLRSDDQGAFGLGPAGAGYNEWWNVTPSWEDDNFPGLTAATAFDDELTFYFDEAMRAVMDNKGASFMNESLGGQFSDGSTEHSFPTTKYTPPTDATWKIINRGSKTYLQLNKLFPMYCVDPAALNGAEYEIVEVDDESLHLLYMSGGNEWHIYLETLPDPRKDMLAGVRGNANGKTWMLDVIVMGDNWWQINPEVSTAPFDDELTFFRGGKAKLDNHGDSYMNESTASLFPDGDTSGGFVTTHYTPADDARWSIITKDDGDYLVLTRVFPMYAASKEAVEGTVEYKIQSLTESKIHIVSDIWNYYLKPKQ